MVGWIVETSLVAAALAAVAAVTPRLRPLGPAARHAMWVVVLVKLVTPPLLAWPWPVVMPSAPGPGPVEAGPQEPEVVRGPVAARRPRPSAVGAVAPSPPARVSGLRRGWRAASAVGPWLLAGGWLAGSLGLASVQVARAVRFRWRLRAAVPAPAWVVEEAGRVGARLGVRVPEALVVPGLGSPSVWCLGRPLLLLPEGLAGALGVDRWRGVLAHELAHLRRGDPWFGRLAVVAGWLWWWNPVFWIARRRMDAEAELACDAWVVWALPGDRFVYAETLLEICAWLSRSVPQARTPMPALGVTGAGRFFERRLTMILRDQVPCRLTLPGALGAGLLALLAVPTWTAAGLAGPRADDPRGEPRAAAPAEPPAAEDEPRDDDDAPKADKARERQKARRAARAERKEKGKADLDLDLSGLEKALGPGSEFAKQMERLGPEIEKAMKEKFGPGSEFEAKMKELSRRIEKEVGEKLGPGSEFEAKMKEFGEHMEKSFGPGSDFEKSMKDSLKDGTKVKEKTRPSPLFKPKPAAPRAARRSREQRIEELERKIDQLSDELKRLKSDDRDDDDDASVESNRVRSPDRPARLTSFRTRGGLGN